MLNQMNKEMMEAAARELQRIRGAGPNTTIRALYDCACIGPLPECRCQRRSRLIQEFIDETLQADS